MIYITGDTHGNIKRLSSKNFPEGRTLTKDDFVIICGDFGLIWDYHGETKEERYWLDWLNDRPFTTLFVDGNHENFDRLYEFPEQVYYGGRVHKIRESVLHLMRGQVFDLPIDAGSTKRIFTLGGAHSHDIRDGVLNPDKDGEKIRVWRRENSTAFMPTRLFRVLGETWWPQEVPSEEEIKEAVRNLDRVQWDVDFIITHDTCDHIKKEMDFDSDSYNDTFSDFLERLYDECHYEKWFFGHLHDERVGNFKEYLLYESIINATE